MGFLKFLSKPKLKRVPELPREKELEIPPGEELPTELPTFPTPEEAPEMKEEELPEGEVVPYVEGEEEKAYETEKQELEERSHLELTKPIFIRADLYKSIIDEIILVKSVLKESGDALTTLEDFKTDEKRSFEKWHIQLEDIQRKLIFVDKSLFGKER